MAVRATDSSVAACAVLGSMAWSSAVSVTGTLAGEARCSGVPWAKAKPVIAPPVPRLTSAVACCHHGLRGGCTDSPSFGAGAAERRPGRGGPPPLGLVQGAVFARALERAAASACWDEAPTAHFLYTSATSAPWPCAVVMGLAHTLGKPDRAVSSADPVYRRQLAA